MTIIIAAKAKQGLYTAYDTAHHEWDTIFPDGSKNCFYNRDVRKITKIAQNAFVGISSGCLDPRYSEERQLRESLADRNDRSLSEILQEEMKKRQKVILGVPEINVPGFFEGNAYVFGVYEKDEFKLYTADKRGLYSLREEPSFVGIGFGWDPEIESSFEHWYSESLSEPEILELLKWTIKQSSNKSKSTAKPGDPRILGFGSAKLTEEGFEEIEFTQDPDELYFDPRKC
ncbi:hypothetical protein ACFLZX_03115 [Nanoarchaeota archaeon]